MTRFLLTTLTVALLTSPALAGDETRQLDSHEHGHGTLNVAIEGQRVLMELEAPGSDIVGFEHVAKSDADKAAVARARATLETPLSLFIFPKEAGCTVTAAKVSVISGEDHDSEEEGEASHDKSSDAHEHETDDGHEPEAAHNEYHGEFELSCARPDSLSSISFPYFDAFPGAQELEVNVITEKSQNTYEVERKNAQINLKGA